MSLLTNPVTTHLFSALVGAGISWWVAKKGAKNVEGDVAKAAAEIKTKV